MGLVLFLGDDDVTSPDVSWSYSGFHMFREWLARSEGFDHTEMYGFGGDRPWSRKQSSTSGNTMAAIPFSDGASTTPADSLQS
ncbi:hypothetical protein [Streptomyces cyaneus]|uniref:hypothetical protein n=1 Tax=Streptomyces cyaneus TaxID=1904 RepID=UPI00319E2DBD